MPQESLSGKRLLQVVGSLAVGGAERVALELAIGFAARGARSEVLVASGQAGTPYERSLRAAAAAAAVTIHEIVVPSIRDQKARQALGALLVGGRVDLVHAHNRPQDWQIVGLARALGIPALYTVHRSYPTRLRHRPLYAALSRAVPRVVCVSSTVARHVRRTEAVPEGRVRVVYNGISLDRFPLSSPKARAARRLALGLREGDFVWISAARLSEAKGHSFLIDAFARLPKASRAVLLLVGDGEMRPSLENQVARLGLAERVRFLGARADVPDLLGAVDGYSCTSLTEGHPLSLLEAMAMELPVVAPRLSSIIEIATLGNPIFFGDELGAMTHRHEPSAIASALTEVERSLPGTAVRRSREHVATHFSAAGMLDAYAEIYGELLATRRNHRWTQTAARILCSAPA